MIRFRAWDKIHKTMYEADDIMSIDFGKSEISVKTLFFERTNCYKFDDIELMQSTGLTDKNGKEIFEGDVLGTKDGLLNGVVNFNTDLGMWTNSLIRYNNFERLCNIANSREIIGNVHANPELLEADS